ncbi:MAG: MFS transporter [Gammaproteobacteria bacterium]
MTGHTAVPPARSTWLFYGWVIVAVAFVTLWVSNGMTLSGLTVFDNELLSVLNRPESIEPLREMVREGGVRGWLADHILTDEGTISRAAYKFRDTLTLLSAGLLGLLAGALADRIGIRPLMVFGLLLLSGCNLMYGRVDSIWEMYGIHFLFGMVLTTCGLIVNVMLVSRWFVRLRGVAIGITLAGTSLGNALLPTINTLLIQSEGWRAAFGWIAILPLLLIPVILWLVRDKPADKGLAPLGGVQTRAGSASSDDLPGMSYGEALRNRNLWLIALIAFCTFYAILGAASNLFLYLGGRGFTPQTAAAGIGLVFTLGLIGKIGSGVLADLVGKKTVFVLGLTVMFAGSLLILFPEAIWAGLILFGLGWGGLYTLLQLLCADIFGLRALGKIIGTITILDAAGGGLGPFLTGYFYDVSGSYQLSFAVIAGLVGAALLAGLLIRIPPEPPGAATDA